MENGTITFDVSRTLDLLEEYSDEEVGKVFRSLLEFSGSSADVVGEGMRKGADLGCRELNTLFKVLTYNIKDTETKLRTKCEQSVNKVRTKCEQSVNKVRTKCDEREEETNKEKEDISPEPLIEEKENKKEKEKDGDEGAYAPLSRVSNETHDAEEAGYNVRARGGKSINLDLQKFVKHFNKCMLRSNIPKIVSISNRRKSWLTSRIKEYGIIAAYRVIINASRSTFLNGGSSQGFVANFDWIFRPNNFPKILEGQYNERTHTIITQSTNSGFVDNNQRQRLEGYASVAAYWRQQADSDPNAMVRQGTTHGNFPY